MSTFVLPQTISNGTTGDADAVMADLVAIRDWINTQLVAKDGTPTFTGFPSLPSVTPSAANDAAPKGYVDTNDADRIKTNNANTLVRRGTASGSTDGSGVLTVTVSPAITAISQVILTPTGTTTAPLRVSAKTGGGSFSVTSTPSLAITFDWIAFGS